MKKIAIESAIIVILSIVCAVVYNSFIEKPLPYIGKSFEETVVPDSILFAFQNMDSDTIPASDIQKTSENLPVETGIENKSTVKDTVKTTKTEQTVKNEPVVTQNPSVGEYTNVTYEQMEKLLKSPEVLIIDARRPDQFADGHIGKSINIFPEGDNKDDYFKKITQLPTNKTIVIYCDGGTCDLSHEVARDLASFGFKRVFIYAGGWEEWQKKQSKT